MTAIQVMGKKIEHIQQEQLNCINDFGYVRPSHRYQYQQLVRQAEEFRRSIKWMENNIYIGR